MNRSVKISAAFFFLFVFYPLTGLQAAPETSSAAWRIEPCTGFGPIQGKTTLADLIRIFGRGNVQETRIEGAEGENYVGSIIFPNDASKRVKVIWKDAVKNAPAEVSVEGTDGIWKTAQGIGLGMSMSDLEKRNNGAFTISGFGWEHGGRLMSWSGGVLGSAFPQSFSLQFAPSKPDHDVAPAIAGDKPVSSSHPALRALNPRVTELSCQFP